METREFIEAIENGKAKVLTLTAAKELKGKRLHTMFLGYEGNYNSVTDVVIGEIISQWDIAQCEPMKGYNNKAEYWESYMTNEQIADKKDTLEIIDTTGKATGIYYNPIMQSNYEEPTFVCSDDDREVYYLIAE